MCLVSAAGKGRDPRGRRGTESRETLTDVDQGTEQLLPLAGTFAGLALSHFPSSHLWSPRGHACWSGPVSPSCLGRKPVVTGELRHMHMEQKQTLSVLGSAVQAPAQMP